MTGNSSGRNSVVEGKGKVNSSGRKKAWSRLRMKSLPTAEKSMVEAKGEVNSIPTAEKNVVEGKDEVNSNGRKKRGGG